MWINLEHLMTHPLFDWKKRNSRKELVNNFSTIVADITGSGVDISPGSAVYKAANNLQNLVKKYKGKKGLEWIMINKGGYLKEHKFDVPITNRNESEIEKSTISPKKRKSFNKLKTRKTKKCRVSNILNQQQQQQQGCEEGQQVPCDEGVQ